MLNVNEMLSLLLTKRKNDAAHTQLRPASKRIPPTPEGGEEPSPDGGACPRPLRDRGNQNLKQIVFSVNNSNSGAGQGSISASRTEACLRVLEEREAYHLAMQTHRPNSKSGDPARNLRENQLGGVIFGCKHDTIEECFRKQLFGLPSVHYSYVRNIKPGLPLFLFNYSDRKLHGLFEAASLGQISIDPYAWSRDGTLSTAFPAQVHIRMKTQYPPLLETQFRKVLVDNYYNHHQFYFELDHAQTTALVSLFKTHAPTSLNLVPAVSNKRSPVVSLPKASVVPEPHEVKTNPSGATNQFSILSNPSGIVSRKWADMADSDADDVSVSEMLCSNTDEKGSGEVVSDWDDLDDDDDVLENQFGPHSNLDVISLKSPVKSVDQGMELVECGPPAVNTMGRERGTFDESMLGNSHNEHIGAANIEEIERTFHGSPGGEQLNPERLTILNKLKDLCSLRRQSILSFQDSVDYTSNRCVPEETMVNADICCDPFGDTVEDKTSFQECHEDADLLQIIADLDKRTEALEKKQIESDQHIHSLKGVVEDSGIKVQQLEYLIDELQFKFDSSLSHLGSMCNSLAKPSIFLIGGYNGVTWLSSLDSLTPDKDILVGLTPMGNARSYASAAVLDGHIFALGGGDGVSWYNTVECYSLTNNEWIECPSLNRKKGSLAGISLNEKIYAIGGGDGNKYFSEVEVFDPYLGKWICSPSMLFSRFALAAAEMNGVIYTSGGYDGSMYLETAERYDPREGFWVKLPSMNTRRGCHALTVLGEALHAMGGYDGESMVSSVEIYDPRLNTWRMGNPMHTPRGYAAAVNLDDSLFLLGGMQSNVKILDTVEVYNASSGWSVLSFSSIGKRSFASAVVM